MVNSVPVNTPKDPIGQSDLGWVDFETQVSCLNLSQLRNEPIITRPVEKRASQCSSRTLGYEDQVK